MTDERPVTQPRSRVNPALLAVCELPLRVSRFAARPGTALSKRPGIGWELNSSREYEFGDDPRSVDWNATARTGSLQVRTQFADVSVVLQLFPLLTRSMLVGHRRSKHAAQVEALMFLAALGSSRGHRSSLYVGAAPKVSLPARNPAVLVESLLGYDLLTGPALPGTEDALDTLQPAISPTLLVATVDLGTLRSRTRSLLEVSAGRDLCVLFVYDPTEVSPPAVGWMAFSSGAGAPSRHLLDTSRVRRYRERVRTEIAAVKHEIEVAGGRFLTVTTDRDVHEQMVEQLAAQRGNGGNLSLP